MCQFGGALSFNISRVDSVVLKAWVLAGDLKRLAENEHELPESNFIAAHERHEPDAKGRVKLTHFWWTGESSGNSLPYLLCTVAPCIIGVVEAIITWERGEALSGLLIKNGKAVECKVQQRLVYPKGW